MSNLVLALEITALGMGLVFAAIILLWWMMVLLTAITAEKGHGADSATPAPVMEDDRKAQAAAVAVAFALAEHQVSFVRPFSDPPATIVSAWQLGTRTKQLYEKGTSIVRKPRKIG